MKARLALLCGAALWPLMVAGCSAGDPSSTAAQSAATRSATIQGSATGSAGSSAAGTQTPTGAAAARCPGRTATVPQGPSGRVRVLSRGAAGGPTVSAVVYPKPQPPGALWSQWGQGLVLPDGRFLSAAGTHDGADGNSYLFVFDPATGELTRFTDVLSLVPHRDGDWGYGKIHAPLVLSGCDDVLFSTYWGDRDGLTYTGSYTGDRLLSLDPWTYRVTDLGVPIPRHGIPSLAGGGGLIYGEAADPQGRAEGASADVGVFFAADPATGAVLYQSGDERHTGFRAIAVTADGAALVAGEGSALLRYQPGGDLRDSAIRLPAGWLRATTSPAADGTIYGVTRSPERFFALAADGTIRDLGPAPGYIASLALAPDGRELLFVPDAHGRSWQQGTPLMAFDPVTRTLRTIVELEPLITRGLSVVAGGSYNIAVDPERGRIFVGLNAGASTENPWGEVVLAVIEP